jgi:hypothetical protein
MSSIGSKPRRPARPKSFRIGKVRAYRRGLVWYLSYREQGRRRQPRIGPDQDLARQTASEINAQLEVGVPSALDLDPRPAATMARPSRACSSLFHSYDRAVPGRDRSFSAIYC